LFGPQGPERAHDVEALVGVEALVLGRHHRLLEDLGDVLRLHRDARVEPAEDADLGPGGVEDVGDPGFDVGLGLGELGCREGQVEHGGQGRAGGDHRRQHGDHQEHAHRLEDLHATEIGVEAGHPSDSTARGRHRCRRERSWPRLGMAPRSARPLRSART